MSDHNFQINLRGIIDLLSNHLYSTPHTFLRELLQNAVDAIAARCRLKGKFEPAIGLELIEGKGPPTLVFEDNGIGLTEDEIHRFIATIGESSKHLADGERDTDFIGQFGIGLLSCFVVADEVTMISRSARGKDAPAFEWKGRADGTYSVRKSDAGFEPGTRVFIRARDVVSDLFAPDVLIERVKHYGGLLPVPIHVVRGGNRSLLNDEGAPWRASYDSHRSEHQAIMGFGESALETRFLDWIPLKSKAGGIDGVAYVLPYAASLAARQKHRVYLKNMLLTESADNLLPEWAFFVRCVVNATKLRPTASRESFYEDEALEQTREELGECLRAYIMELRNGDRAQLERLIAVHHRSFKALAADDDDFFRIIADLLPFETSHGSMSLGDIRKQERVLRYAPTVDQFRQISSIAAAQGYCVVNGGYAYDTDLLERVPHVFNETEVESVNASELVQEFEDLTTEEHDAVFAFLRAADAALRPFQCRTDIRKFMPEELPALYSLSAEGQFRRSVELTKEVSNELWSGLMDSVAGAAGAPGLSELTFNFRNPLVQRIAKIKDPMRLHLAAEMLYVQSLLMGHHPLKGRELELLNRGLIGLLELGLDGQ
jgi:molecular chaperone HtpG